MGDLPGGVFLYDIQGVIPDGRPTLHRSKPISLRSTPNQYGLVVGWDCATANVADNTFQWLIRQVDGRMIVLLRRDS